MICYSLKCSSDHSFDSWFQSAAAYDLLTAAGRLSCPVCGVPEVAKSLMAPALRPTRDGAADVAPARPLATPATDVEAALATLRKQIEENSDYVGLNFAAEARRIHDGDAPERSIYGEARPDEARALIADGGAGGPAAVHADAQDQLKPRRATQGVRSAFPASAPPTRQAPL